MVHLSYYNQGLTFALYFIDRNSKSWFCSLNFVSFYVMHEYGV